MMRSGLPSIRAFTLVELMVTLTITIILIGSVGAVYARSSRVAIASMSLIHLYQKREAINRVIEQDFGNLLDNAAVIIDPQQGQATFLTIPNRHPGQEGSYFAFKRWRGRDITWAQWRWDHAQGRLSRGTSRETPAYQNIYATTAQLNTTGSIASNAMHPTAQRHALFLVGSGAIDNSLTFTGIPGSRQQVFDRFHEASPALRPASSYYDSFVGEDPYMAMRSFGVVGNTTPIANAFAVRNADGLGYNKDWINLVGVDGSSQYPNQVRSLADGCEYPTIEWFRRDGSPITVADDSDSLNDGAATIDIAGSDPNLRLDPSSISRPARVVVTYVLHDVPLLGSGGRPAPIDLIRQDIAARTDLNDPNPLIEAANRRAAMMTRIQSGRHHAILVVKSVRIAQ